MGMKPIVAEERIARQPTEAQGIIRLLLAKIAELEARVEGMQRQAGGKTPQNSSLPPSTQHPHAKPPRRKRKSKKKRGGQPGHPKHDRPLIPSEDCDDVEPLKPTECRRCGNKLSGSDPEPLRHQVWELPEIKPHVTGYQRHRLACACCGETTCAKLPPGVPEGQSGPRLMAFTALLMAYYDLRRATCKLFEHWADYRDGTISRAAFVRRMAPVRREVERLLLRGLASGNKSLVGMCRELHEHRDWLWTFVRCEGVEPTNNAGERALRHAVIWRKLSFGTQSAAGSRFVETMLTVIETCRQQNRNAFEYLTDAVQAHLAGQPAPSLLPRV